MSFISGIGFELGIGLAIGMLAGTTGTHGSARGRMTLLAAVIGLAIGALLSGHANLDTPVGAVVCLLGAGFACIVVSDVVSGAGRREGSGSGALGFMVSLVVLVVVAPATPIPPGALVVLAGLTWLAISRRRRAQRKHAGLRVLK
jgi:uncharacterized protein (TIGR03382 family)